ncbi:MAG: redoxin domain-containing protein, partial [Propionibacteriales bacterium]|nr:redoxin domain-containing protein [Propionibacteriales bacterium]
MHHADFGDDARVFAISYDQVPVLALFAAEHGITYPMLSDEGRHI